MTYKLDWLCSCFACELKVCSVDAPWNFSCPQTIFPFFSNCDGKNNPKFYGKSIPVEKKSFCASFFSLLFVCLLRFCDENLKIEFSFAENVGTQNM